jgi:hypothetical protein
MAPAPLFEDRYLGEHRGTAYRRLPPGIAARGAVCVAIAGHRERSSIRLLHALTEQGMILEQSRGRRDTRDGRQYTVHGVNCAYKSESWVGLSL